MDYYAFIREHVQGAQDCSLRSHPSYHEENTPTGVEVYFGETLICTDILDATEIPTHQVDGFLDIRGNLHIAATDADRNTVLYSFDNMGKLVGTVSYTFDAYGECWLGHSYAVTSVINMFMNFEESNFTHDDKLTVRFNEKQVGTIQYAGVKYTEVDLRTLELYELYKYVDNTSIVVVLVTVPKTYAGAMHTVNVETKYFDRNTYDLIHSSTCTYNEQQGIGSYYDSSDYKALLQPYHFEEQDCSPWLDTLVDEQDTLEYFYHGVVVGRIANDPRDLNSLSIYKGVADNYTMLNAITSSGVCDDEWHTITTFLGSKLLRYEQLIHMRV